MYSDHVLYKFDDNAATADILDCVSTIDLIKKTAIYQDDTGIIYRSRKKLTIQENNGLDDMDICEKKIYLEYYIKKRKDLEPKTLLKPKKFRKEKIPSKLRAGEKGEIPEIGQYINFYVMGLHKNDEDELKSWRGKVLNVYSGTMTLADEEGNLKSTFNENVGLILVEVINPGLINRSLRYPPKNRIKKARVAFAT